jgi:hypothetical protein
LIYVDGNGFEVAFTSFSIMWGNGNETEVE